MPGIDGTGPMGMGPMTGGGRGCCAVPWAGDAPAVAFGGFARFRGRGRRYRWMYRMAGLPAWMRFGGSLGAGPVPAAAEAGPAREQERSALQAQAEQMRGQLEAITARISELAKQEPRVE